MSALRKKLLMAVAAAAICTLGHPPGASAQTSGIGGDGNTRFVWRGTDSSICLWKLNPGLGFLNSHCYGPFDGWLPIAVTTTNDNNTVVLWRFTDGTVSLWLVDSNLNFLFNKFYGPFTGWIAEGLSADTDGFSFSRLIWRETQGFVSVWCLDPSLAFCGSNIFGPFFGYDPGSAQTSPKSSVSSDADRKAAAAMETDAGSPPVSK